MIEAMHMVLAGVTPWTAAKRAGLAPNTMYRSRLYAMWKDRSQHAELRLELNIMRPVPRYKKKSVRFARNDPD